MTTYCAVVKYPIDATDNEKIALLKDGMSSCATELIDLGCALEVVGHALDDALSAAQDEYDAIKDNA